MESNIIDVNKLQLVNLIYDELNLQSTLQTIFEKNLEKNLDIKVSIHTFGDDIENYNVKIDITKKVTIPIYTQT